MSNLKIALPPEAREHLNQNHTIYVPTKAGFCHCSCGISFRVGIIVDSDNLVTEDPFVYRLEALARDKKKWTEL